MSSGAHLLNIGWQGCYLGEMPRCLVGVKIFEDIGNTSVVEEDLG